jgi:ribosomal protein S18
MDGIPNKKLNIIIFKYFIRDSVCKIKLKFSIRTKNYKNPSIYFNFVHYFVGKIVSSRQSEMCTSVRNALITSALKFSFRR